MQVGSGFSKDGVSVSETGTTTMTVDIAAAGVSITFDGQVFHIQLSYSHFSHNTEGQCGERALGRRGHRCPARGRAGGAGERRRGDSAVLPPRHLHQQPDGRLPPAGRHHGRHLPRHGPPLAGARERPGGLCGAYPPAPDGGDLALRARHARLVPVPPRAPLRAAAEPVSRPRGSGACGVLPARAPASDRPFPQALCGVPRPHPPGPVRQRLRQ